MYDPFLPPGMKWLKYVLTEAANESCSVKMVVKRYSSSTATVNFFEKRKCEELVKL